MSYRPLVDWYVNDFGLTVVNIALVEILTLKSLMSENPETIITPKIVQWTYEIPKKETK